MSLHAGMDVVQTLFPGAISADSIGTVLVVSGTLIGVEGLLVVYASVRWLLGRGRTVFGRVLVDGTMAVVPQALMVAFGGCALACVLVHDGLISGLDGVMSFLLLSLGSFLWECHQRPWEESAPPSSRQP